MGFDIERGRVEKTQGVSGLLTIVYVHPVLIYVPGSIIPIQAGFCHELPLAGLLGRRGFLDHFRFTLDPSTNPPEFELERVLKA
jgi:hypothetical protein